MSWFLTIVILAIAFQIYLIVTQQHVVFHSQNLSNKKPPAPMWRHGRCWWYITPNDEKQWRHGPGARAEWSFSRSETFALDITVLDEEGDDIQFHIGIPYIISLFFTLERLPFLEQLPNRWRRNFGYETSIKFFSGSLWIHFLHSEMWGTKHGSFRRWLPSWISIATSAGYKEWKGVGFYICFNFDRLILGNHERTEENIGEPETREIPIEPDNSLGLHYFAVFQPKRETYWRSHFPWRKHIYNSIDISTDAPPMHAGKGENSYDLDDDGIFGTTPRVETIEEAIVYYQECVYRDRKKYGMPSAVDEAQK